MEKIKCPECGEMVEKVKFCSECGFKLEQSKAIEATKMVEQTIKDVPMMKGLSMFKPETPANDNTTVSDKGLKMLVDCCRKTEATVGGDGYSELVLYERSSDEYELHYYSKYEYDSYEKHYAYKATKEIVDNVYAYLKEAKLTEIPEGFGLCGGDYIVKYLMDGQVERVSLSMIDEGYSSKLYKVESIISVCKTDDNILK